MQILLEVCLPTLEEQQLGANTESLLRSIRGSLPGKSKQGNLVPRTRGDVEAAEPEGGLLSDLREVQCLICCLLHQMFIADPNIAKLVHFQVTQWQSSEVGCILDICFFTVTMGTVSVSESEPQKRDCFTVTGQNPT